MPTASWAWLKTFTSGFPLQGPEWEGWQFKAGKFWSPEGQSFGMGDIRALPYTMARIEALETANAPSNVVPLRPESPRSELDRRRHEYRGRITTIVRAILSLENDLQGEFDHPALQALAPQIHQLAETACRPIAELAQQTWT